MNPLITVIGPTATGKSDLAVLIARHIEGRFGRKVEIISADSRQIYRHLNIGTGKITVPEMQAVPHHMLDVIEPNESFSVYEYGKCVRKILGDIYNRGAIPILCGGTGFYIDAVVYGNVGAETPPNRELQAELEKYTVTELQERLYTLSQERNANISHVDLKNKRRIIRAIEILEMGGTFARKNETPLFDMLQIGLDTNSENLRSRIERRLMLRMEGGMVEESERLLENGSLTHKRMRKLGLEYRFISMLIQKEISLPDFMEKLFFAIWHYAKRQRVWFRKYSDIAWFDSDQVKVDAADVGKLVDEFLAKSSHDSAR